METTTPPGGVFLIKLYNFIKKEYYRIISNKRQCFALTGHAARTKEYPRLTAFVLAVVSGYAWEFVKASPTAGSP